MKQVAAHEQRPSGSLSVSVGSHWETTSTTTTAIATQGLTKVYGNNVAVKDLSFEVTWGKVTGFLRPQRRG
jgi:hypothetical protein